MTALVLVSVLVVGFVRAGAGAGADTEICRSQCQCRNRSQYWRWGLPGLVPMLVSVPVLVPVPVLLPVPVPVPVLVPGSIRAGAGRARGFPVPRQNNRAAVCRSQRRGGLGVTGGLLMRPGPGGPSGCAGSHHKSTAGSQGSEAAGTARTCSTVTRVQDSPTVAPGWPLAHCGHAWAGGGQGPRDRCPQAPVTHGLVHRRCGTARLPGTGPSSAATGDAGDAGGDCRMLPHSSGVIAGENG